LTLHKKAPVTHDGPGLSLFASSVVTRIRQRPGVERDNGSPTPWDWHPHGHAY